MRRIRYHVATSLDGYIAGPKGEFDWIVMDPDIDFAAIFAEYDTLFAGRRSYEAMATAGGGAGMYGMPVYVFSRTLKQRDHPDVTIVNRKWKETVAALRATPGKDIWLFGGGQLFRSLADAGLVDTVEVAVIPVLLGKGIPLLAPPAKRVKLKLTGQRTYAKTGIVLLQYAVR